MLETFKNAQDMIEKLVPEELEFDYSSMIIFFVIMLLAIVVFVCSFGQTADSNLKLSKKACVFFALAVGMYISALIYLKNLIVVYNQTKLYLNILAALMLTLLIGLLFALK